MSASHENLRGLRLTLRTLLAWLDDTLGPEEVRNIGKQVAESPVATELVDRIKHVTRQRRLGVPPSTGADAVDPNLVASYLDSELDSDKVTEYEKLCLRSNVHLAEVASAHQILSLIGQKAKVPAATRQRMYRLVRGREAVRRKVPVVAPVVDSSMRLSAPGVRVAPALDGSGTEEVWSPEMSPRGPILPRLALPAAIAALVGLMGLSAWMLAPPVGRGPAVAVAKAKAEPVRDLAPAEVPALPPPPVAVAAPPAEVPAPDVEPEKAEMAAADAGLEPPAGTLGIVSSLDGPFLKWNEEARSWDRAAVAEPLRAGREMVALSPFRPVLKMGPVRVEMIGRGAIVAREFRGGEAARFTLLDGRVRLTAGPDQEAKVTVSTGGAEEWTLTLPPGQIVGLEREARRGPGQPGPSPSALSVAVLTGDVPVEMGESRFTVAGPRVAVLEPNGTSEVDPDARVPDWVDDPSPTALERTQGQAFADGFGPETRTLAALAEAVEAEDRGTRELALSGLASVGAYDLIVAELNRAGDPTLRRDAIAALRRIGSRDAASAERLHLELTRFVSATWADEVETLLFGFPPEKARTEATMKRLVELLSHPDVSVRELAIDQLRSLTGRDALDYDADQPTGPGLKAWQDLLRSGELAAPSSNEEGAGAAPSSPPPPPQPAATKNARPKGGEPARPNGR